ncbi:MAG: DUF2726 domain-containing protein [Treponema sp.]|nr:DUF2726 domain-containing protein [Treponema sp.]
MNKNIALAVSKAIRQGSWLDVDYHNKKGENTHFLFAVKDVDTKTKRLKGDCFNPNLQSSEYPLKKDYILDFNRFFSASAIHDISYSVPPLLIKKLESCDVDEDFLHFNEMNNNIFLFLEQCVQFDTDLTISNFKMIEGIDADSFTNNNKITITNAQSLFLARELCNWKKQEGKKQQIFRLALNFLSIRRNERNVPIVYKEVLLNLADSSLELGKSFQFAKSYLLDRGDNAPQFLNDMTAEAFIQDFAENTDFYIDEIRKNLLYGETINTNPEFMKLASEYNVHFQRVRNSVSDMMKNRSLTLPIKAFLGMNNKMQGGRKRNVAVVTYDNKVNIDQVRVVFNSLRENLTYVEGPPGTGKTQTILNVIFSQFFENRTCLICSNNNLPIEGIIEKLTNDLPLCNGQKVLFPLLRIGNVSIMQKTLSDIRRLYEEAMTKNAMNDTALQKQNESVKKNTQSLCRALQSYEQKLDIEAKVDSLKNWRSSTPSKLPLHSFISKEISILEEQKKTLENVTNEDVKSLCITASENESFINYLYYHSIKLLQKLNKAEYKPFISILFEENKEKAVKDFRNYLSDDSNIELLLDVFPVWITTNISAEKIGSSTPHFDLCIMDESGQCDIARSLIPIIRASRLLLVGDTNQLRPIVLLDENKHSAFQKEFHIEHCEIYDYLHQSILSLMQKTDSISKKILLSYHYRCASNIIKFSNEYYYEKRLHIENDRTGDVALTSVKNIGGNARNCYEEEANAVVDFIKKGRFDGEKVAVVAPFKNQVALINKKLSENNISGVTVGTIHKVQGAEYDTVVLSTAIAKSSRQKTFDWIKNNTELINVAVTRAKQSLAVIADEEAVKTLSKGEENAIQSLVSYAKYVGKDKNVVVSPPKKRNLSNNSEYERQFFATLSQVLSTTGNLSIERNVPMKSVFPNAEKMFPEYYALSEFDVVLYKKRSFFKKAVLIIELDGGEHFISEKSKENDRKKELLCKNADIKVFRVPNEFASHYALIKAYIEQMSEMDLQASLF